MNGALVPHCPHPYVIHHSPWCRHLLIYCSPICDLLFIPEAGSPHQFLIIPDREFHAGYYCAPFTLIAIILETFIRGGSMISRRRGRQPSMGRRQHTNFPKNCMKFRKVWSVEGGVLRGHIPWIRHCLCSYCGRK